MIAKALKQSSLFCTLVAGRTKHRLIWQGLRFFEVTEIVNHEGRMTFEQREKLWHLCQGYNVPFRETDYHRSAIGYGSYADLPPSYEGWVGGDFYSNNKAGGQKTIYVMVEHDGRSHT